MSQDDGETQLKEAIDAAVARQGASPIPQGTPQVLRTVQSTPNSVFETLAGRIPELDAIGPQGVNGGLGLDLGPDTTGSTDPEVQLSLKSAIAAAVRNNLSVQGSRIEQSIAETDVVKAEAAFDAVLLAGSGYQTTNVPPPPINIPGGLNDAFAPENSQTSLSTGIQKRLISGGTVAASVNMINTQQSASIYNPKSYWTNSVNFNVSQPLLQGFGSDVNEAQIRLARNRDRASVVNLRQTLLNVVEQTEIQYWTVLYARQQVVAAAWLLKVGSEVRDVLKKRLNFDATVADYALAVAIVEQRKANLIRAWLKSRDESDRLKLLMNDPAVSVGTDSLMVPIDLLCQQPIKYNLRDAIVTAVEQNPSIATAVLRIDDAAIGMLVADNGRLPQLGLIAGVSLAGQDTEGGADGSMTGAFTEVADANYVSWLAKLAFSQPIGNRAAEAQYRQARLQRSAAVISYQSAIENAVFAVKTSLRGVTTSYELIDQTRASRLAAAESVRSLAVLEQTLAALTPEFLQTKFVAQDRLATSYLAEIESMVNYNTAMARLFNAMGTGLTMNQIDIEVFGGDR
ncbi:MAG: TolC family protein [Planctomycetota bacterium]|nr:TolC family protein [Planctomycetota bacterium]